METDQIIAWHTKHDPFSVAWSHDVAAPAHFLLLSSRPSVIYEQLRSRFSFLWPNGAEKVASRVVGGLHQGRRGTKISISREKNGMNHQPQTQSHQNAAIG